MSWHPPGSRRPSCVARACLLPPHAGAPCRLALCPTDGCNLRSGALPQRSPTGGQRSSLTPALPLASCGQPGPWLPSWPHAAPRNVFLPLLSLKTYSVIRKSELQRGQCRDRERDFPIAGSLSKCPQELWLVQAEARSLELRASPTWVLGPRHLGRLSQANHKELNRLSSGWDLSWSSRGLLMPVTQLAAATCQPHLGLCCE